MQGVAFDVLFITGNNFGPSRTLDPSHEFITVNGTLDCDAHNISHDSIICLLPVGLQNSQSYDLVVQIGGQVASVNFTFGTQDQIHTDSI